MINRYQGNSGRVVKIEDQNSPRVYSGRPGNTQPPPPPPKANSQNVGGKRNSGTAHKGNGIQSVLSQLGKLLPGSAGKVAALETEDIILLLILYLMYRESGDSELLMMMGAMFLL